jgi:rubredoxin
MAIESTRVGATPADMSSSAPLRLWACLLCGFVYDESEGLPEIGISPGTRWEDVPDDFICPDCSASKADFEMVEV